MISLFLRWRNVWHQHETWSNLTAQTRPHEQTTRHTKSKTCRVVLFASVRSVMCEDAKHRGGRDKNRTSQKIICEFYFLVGDRYRFHSPKPILNLTCLSAFSSPLVSNEILLPSPTQIVSDCTFSSEQRGKDSDSWHTSGIWLSSWRWSTLCYSRHLRGRTGRRTMGSREHSLAAAWFLSFFN